MQKKNFGFKKGVWRLMALSFLFILTFSLHGFGQSPDVSAFNRRIESPVSMYAGSPQIGMSVGGVSGRSLSVGVGLSYNASGIRVADYGSWTGIGWNLSVGGLISRNIQGLDDFSTNGYLNNGQVDFDGIDKNCEAGTNDYHDDMNDIMNDLKDSSPDIFYFSMPGGSGKFIFDQQGNPQVLDQFGIKIEISDNYQNFEDNQWTITTLDGTKYVFGGYQRREYSNGAITGWYLHKIISTIGEEAVFNYDQFSYNYQIDPSGTKYHLLLKDEGSDCESFVEGAGTQTVDISAKYLSNVTIGQSKIKFITGPRCDLPGARLLDKVQLFHNNDELLKEYDFVYDCDNVKNRLWLLSVQEIGVSDMAYKPTTFEYYNRELFPSVTSRAQDHWGFYNGANNSSLIPAYNMSPDFYFDGANRDTDTEKIKYGTLSKVTYPTGGFTEYEFESHHYQAYTSEDDTYNSIPTNLSACQGADCANITSAPQTFTLTHKAVINIDFNVSKGSLLVNNKPSSVKVWLSETGVSTKFMKEVSGINEQESGSHTLLLEPGTYEIGAELVGGTSGQSDHFASIEIDYNRIVLAGTAVFPQHGGGLRVKKITSNDGESLNPPIVKRYQYLNPQGTSSGKLMIKPNYFYYTELVNVNVNTNPISTSNCTYLVMTSSSVVPLSTSANGSYVGYDYVMEYEGEANDAPNGRVVYEYYNVEDEVNQGITLNTLSNGLTNNALPYASSIVVEPRKGYVKKRTVERSYGTSYLPIEETAYDYNQTQEYTTPGWLVYGQMNEFIVSPDRCKYIQLAKYDITSSLIHLDNMTSTSYDGKAAGVGQSMSNSTTYTYDLSFPYMLKSTTTEDSEGKIYTSKIRRVTEFGDNVMNGVIGEMKARNLIGAVIENQQWSGPAGSDKLLSSTISEFKLVNNVVLPEKSYVSVINEAQPSWPTYNGNSTPDASLYELVATNSYSDDHLLLQSTDITDQSQSFIYGYPNKMVIASASNATADQIAYSSFEKDALGNWDGIDVSQIVNDESKTGRRAYNGASLSKSNIPAGDYMVSMWAKGGGTIDVMGETKTIDTDWKYYVWRNLTLDGSVLITSSGAIMDEVRLHPSTSIMQSSTYIADIGMSSSTGPNGKSTYSEYDNLHRRKLVKDQDGNVVSRMSYRFKGATGRIKFGNVDRDQSTLFKFVGSENRDDLTFTWDFGDGAATQTGRWVNKVYTSLGYHLITLTITDSQGNEDIYHANAFVNGNLAGEIVLVDNGARELTASVINNGSNPSETTYQWDFGAPTSIDYGLSASHIYNSLGRYTITLTMSHPSFGTKQLTTSHVLAGNLVTGNLTASPATQEEDVSIKFISQKINTNAEGTIYTWDFGDGNQSDTNSNEIDHSFAVASASGTPYTVTVKATHPDYPDAGQKSTNVSIIYGNPVLSGPFAPEEADPDDHVFEFDINDAQNGAGGYTYTWQTAPIGNPTNWTTQGTTNVSAFTITLNQTVKLRVRATDQSGGVSSWKEADVQVGVFPGGL